MSESEFSDDSTFGLDQVLGAIRRDLKAAQKASASDPLGLFVQSVDVELAFTVESSRQGEVESISRCSVSARTVSGSEVCLQRPCTVFS